MRTGVGISGAANRVAMGEEGMGGQGLRDESSGEGEGRHQGPAAASSLETFLNKFFPLSLIPSLPT